MAGEMVESPPDQEDASQRVDPSTLSLPKAVSMEASTMKSSRDETLPGMSQNVESQTLSLSTTTSTAPGTTKPIQDETLPVTMSQAPKSQSRTFPEICPPEVREHIFRYVLSSPAGRVALCRAGFGYPLRYAIYTEDEEPKRISLGLLRRCRTIYKDCHDLFWKCNTLDLDSLLYESYISGWRQTVLLKSNLTHHIRSVDLDLDLLASNSIHGIFDDRKKEHNNTLSIF